MRKSRLRLYAPFLALALVQAMFVLVAPSKGGRQELTAGPLGAGSAPTAGASSSYGGSAGSGDAGAAGATGANGAAAAGTTGGPAGATASGPSAATGGGTTTGGTAAAAGGGDRSHCTKDGLQQGITFYSPPCQPKWAGGNNGGGTYQGVSDKEINIVFFRETPNEQVSAILRTQGLADSNEDINNFVDAAVQFINQKYELYGRKIKLTKVLANCPQTPPDIPKCKEDARKVIATKPFAVVWNTSLYSAVFDEFARAGIIAIGGWNQGSSFFNGRRPYRYDFVMNGTESAQVIGDYYCKKLAGKNADHSGPIIHPTIGGRGQVGRKLGIVTPDDPANVEAAKVLQNMVNGCDHKNPPIYTYESDINRAQEQTNATVAGLIQNKVTTVVCMCDPIAPVFLTKGLTSQNYFPEYLVSGTQFSDYDLVGRLYDPQQMAHAFGPSQLSDFLPFDQQDQSKVWHATGHAGELPCKTCGTFWAEFSLLGTLLQQAGANLNPLTAERGMLSLGGRGGQRYFPFVGFGQGDYTGIDDAREVYWSATQISPVDGKPGMFVSIDSGRRWRAGQFGRDFRIPAPTS